MSKRHNPRLLTVHKEKLTFAHRQCVKPDQVCADEYLTNIVVLKEMEKYTRTRARNGGIGSQTTCTIRTVHTHARMHARAGSLDRSWACRRHASNSCIFYVC